jgi:hypothetical protein
MPEMRGGCRCGAVRYVANADPVFVGLCHCRNCQKETGSAFSVVLGLPANAVAVSGTVKVFDSVGDSGKATHRAFCPTCGSSVTHWADILEGLTMVNAGTLDDPSWVRPTSQIYCDSAQPWVELGGGMQSFPRMPPA